MWNRRYYYREKIKKAACWALIIILLPYIVTVFVNGPKIVTASKVDEMTIDVKGGGKMPVEKYCIGILARDMPAEYEEEALKAQAILVRTEVYRAIRDAGEGQKLEKEFWTEKQMKSAWGMRYAENYRELKNALESTAGQVLFYEDGLAMTPFFNLSNGYTRDAKEVLGKEEYPYLKIVECPEDVNAEDAAVYGSGSYVDLYKGALTYTDIVVKTDDNLNADVLKFVEEQNIRVFTPESADDYEGFSSLYEEFASEEVEA